MKNCKKEKKPENQLTIQTVYFIEQNSFEEVEIFIDEIKELLQFTQIKLERNFKDSLKYMINEQKLKAVIMGNRRNDPYCEKLDKLSPSDVDKGYPAFVRINPIIDWNYEQVWKFLLDLEIPYCCLYNKGYTYLGNKSNTQKNEHLKISNSDNNSGEVEYLPAYKLVEFEYECASRSKLPCANNLKSHQQQVSNCDDSQVNGLNKDQIYTIFFIGNLEQYINFLQKNSKIFGCQILFIDEQQLKDSQKLKQIIKQHIQIQENMKQQVKIFTDKQIQLKLNDFITDYSNVELTLVE